MTIRGVASVAAAVLACILVSGRAQAQQIFLEVPGVQGEVVTPAAFVNQIEILSVSVGGSKLCANPLSMSDLSLMKLTDKASVDLAIALRDHTVIPTMTLRFTAASGAVYQSYVLTNAVLTSFQISGSGGGAGRTTESVSLAFSQMAVTYQFIDGAGKPSGPAESMTFTAASCP